MEPIAPTDPLPFIPKGRHSVFYQTAMSHLLSIEDVKRVVMVGQVTEQCILYSALDAYLRGYELVVPKDAVAHIDPELADAALKMMERNLHAELTPAAQVFALGAHVVGQVLAGQGRAPGDEVRRRALEDDVAALVAGARAEVDDPVGVRHHGLVVLDHDHGLAESTSRSSSVSSCSTSARCRPVVGSSST